MRILLLLALLLLGCPEKKGCPIEVVEDEDGRTEYCLSHGIRHGEYIRLRPDGSLKAKGHYVDGTPDGDLTLFDEGGRPSARSVYQNGRIVSFQKL